MSELVADIEAAALGTPGVLALYRTGSTVAKLIEAGVERLTSADTVPARASVTEREGKTDVELAIGIEAPAGAAETANNVRAEVEKVLASHGAASSFVRVTVVRVADAQSAGA